MKYFLLFLYIILLIESVLDDKFKFVSNVSVKNLFLYILFLLTTIKYVKENRRLPKDIKILLLAFVFLLIYTATNFFYVYLIGIYENYYLAVYSLKSWLGDQFIFFILFILAINNRNDSKWLINKMFFIIVVLNIITFFDAINIIDLPSLRQIDSGHVQDGRVQGYMQEQNQFAAFLVFTLPLLISQFLNSKHFRKVFYGAGIFSTICLLILSGSRGGVTGLVIGSILFYVYFFRNIPHKKVAYIFIVGLFFSFSALVLSLSKYENLIVARYIDAVQQDDLNRVSAGRIDTWKLSLRSLSENPHTFLTGYGWDSSLYNLNIHSLHNTYLEFFYELGLIGLFLILFIFYKIISYVKQCINIFILNEHERFYFLMFCWGVFNLIVTLFFVDLYKPWLFVWMIIALNINHLRFSCTD